MYFYIMLAGAILTVFYVIVKIRHHKLETNDAIFWFFFSLLLVLFALFPPISDFFSEVFGFQNPVNFLLVLIIALLLYHQLAQSVDLVKMRSQLNDIAEKIALMQEPNSSISDEKNREVRD